MRLRDGRVLIGLAKERLDAARLDQRVRAHAVERVREVAPDDPLLHHPEVADVEVEVVAARGAADDNAAEARAEEDRGGEALLAAVLEDEVRAAALAED